MQGCRGMDTSTDKLIDSDLTRAQLVALLRQAQTERDLMQHEALRAWNALTKAEIKLSVLGNPDPPKHEVIAPADLPAEWARLAPQTPEEAALADYAAQLGPLNEAERRLLGPLNEEERRLVGLAERS